MARPRMGTFLPETRHSSEGVAGGLVGGQAIPEGVQHGPGGQVRLLAVVPMRGLTCGNPAHGSGKIRAAGRAKSILTFPTG